MFSSKLRVAVLRGGPTKYAESLKTGQHVLSFLREMPEQYEPVDIFISNDGEWHLSGLVEEPHRALRHIDAVWNALHGVAGNVQRFLERLKIPFTGSSSLSSALAANQTLARNILIDRLILVPDEEGIGGERVSCAVVEDVRGENLYALIPIGKTALSEKKEVERLSKLAHQALGLRHYSSSDFIVTPKRKIYLVNTDSHPEFHADSNLHNSLHAVGWHPRDFVSHCLNLALRK